MQKEKIFFLPPDFFKSIKVITENSVSISPSLMQRLTYLSNKLIKTYATQSDLQKYNEIIRLNNEIEHFADCWQLDNLSAEITLKIFIDTVSILFPSLQFDISSIIKRELVYVRSQLLKLWNRRTIELHYSKKNLIILRSSPKKPDKILDITTYNLKWEGEIKNRFCFSLESKTPNNHYKTICIGFYEIENAREWMENIRVAGSSCYVSSFIEHCNKIQKIKNGINNKKIALDDSNFNKKNVNFRDFKLEQEKKIKKKLANSFSVESTIDNIMEKENNNNFHEYNIDNNVFLFENEKNHFLNSPTFKFLDEKNSAEIKNEIKVEKNLKNIHISQINGVKKKKKKKIREIIRKKILKKKSQFRKLNKFYIENLDYCFKIEKNKDELYYNSFNFNEIKSFLYDISKINEIKEENPIFLLDDSDNTDNIIIHKMKYKHNEERKKLKNERLRDKKPEILSMSTNFKLILNHLKKPIPYNLKMTTLYEKYEISFEKLIHFLIEPIHIKKSNNYIIDIKIRSKKNNNQILMFLKFKSKNNTIYETILLRNFFENQRYFIIFDEEFNEKDPIFSRITIIKDTKELFIDLKCNNSLKKQDYFDFFSEFLFFKKQKCMFFDQEQIRTKEISDLIFLNKKKFIGYKNRALSTFISKNFEEGFLKNFKKKKRENSENIKKFENYENCENFKNLKKILIFQQNKVLSNIIDKIPINLNIGIDIYKLNLPNIFFSKKSALEILSSFFLSCDKILKKTEDFLEISKFYLCFLFDLAQNSCKIKFPNKSNKGETLQIQYQNLKIYLETIISNQNSQIYYLNLIKNNEWKITGSISLNFICQGLKFIQKIKPNLKLTVNNIEIICEKFPKIEIWIENNEKNYIFLGKLKITDVINKIYSEISFGNSFSFGEINQNNKCFRGEIYSLKNNEKARRSKIFGKIDEYIEFDGNLYWEKEKKAKKYIFKPIENEFILPSDCLNRKIIKKLRNNK